MSSTTAAYSPTPDTMPVATPSTAEKQVATTSGGPAVVKATVSAAAPCTQENYMLSTTAAYSPTADANITAATPSAQETAAVPRAARSYAKKATMTAALQTTALKVPNPRCAGRTACALHFNQHSTAHIDYFGMNWLSTSLF